MTRSVSTVATELCAFCSRRNTSSTYKPMLLKALLDLTPYSKYSKEGISKEQIEGQEWLQLTSDAKSLRVDLNFIAVRFVRFYWPLLFKFNLRQTTNPKGVAINKILEDHFDDSRRIPSKKELCSDQFARLRKEVINRAIKPQALKRLLNDCRVYRIIDGGNRIEIDRQVLDYFAENKKAIEFALNYLIVRFLDGINLSMNIAKKLEGKQKRTKISAKIFSRIIKNQGDRCFYCGRESNDELVQEHFIPFNYTYDDKAFNIVAACRDCNSQKGDLLATDRYLNNIVERNRSFFKDDPEYREELFKSHYNNCHTEYQRDRKLWFPNISA